MDHSQSTSSTATATLAPDEDRTIRERSRTRPERTAAATPAPAVTWAIEWKLYLSHLLSTWNSRSFEFGSVLFLAHIYPDTLFFLSLYAIVRSASAIVFSPAIGHAIDRHSRLHAVRTSIVAGRLSIVLSALGFWALWTNHIPKGMTRQGIFAGLVILSCVEKASFVANTVSVERDWVVVIAGGNEQDLNKINARMRRIDLVCKLMGPLIISLIDGASTEVAIWFLFGLNAPSLFIEYFAILNVYHTRPSLQQPKVAASGSSGRGTNFNGAIFRYFQALLKSFPDYLQHPACLASLALSLLYLTVLSFGGQMVTYLLSAGFNSFHIALARSLSVLVEISATWIAPRVIASVTATRGAMWFLSWQIGWLTATVIFFWIEPSAIAAAAGLTAGAILSRVGLWGFDLCAQVIIQQEVSDTTRGSFSSIEQLFQNAFELISYVLTLVASRPDQFKYPVLVSLGAVISAGCLYTYFLRKRRGHLMHVPHLTRLIRHD